MRILLTFPQIVALLIFVNSNYGDNFCDCYTDRYLTFVSIGKVVTSNFTSKNVPDGYKAVIITPKKVCRGNIHVNRNARLNAKACDSGPDYTTCQLNDPFDRLKKCRFYLLKGFQQTINNTNSFILDHCSEILEVESGSTCKCIVPLESQLYAQIDLENSNVL